VQVQGEYSLFSWEVYVRCCTTQIVARRKLIDLTDRRQVSNAASDR